MLLYDASLTIITYDLTLCDYSVTSSVSSYGTSSLASSSPSSAQTAATSKLALKFIPFVLPRTPIPSFHQLFAFRITSSSLQHTITLLPPYISQTPQPRFPSDVLVHFHFACSNGCVFVVRVPCCIHYLPLQAKQSAHIRKTATHSLKYYIHTRSEYTDALVWFAL